MIAIKSKSSLQKMDEGGKLLAEIFTEITPMVCVGSSTFEIDSRIDELIHQKGLVSKMKGYMGYRHASCISINDEVVHGVPDKVKILQDGDLVKIDVCASWKNYCADMARVFFVGSVPEELKKFVSVAQRALDAGIKHARCGNRLSDISFAIQQEVERGGYSVVRDFAGHGIGKHMHEEPEILNYGSSGTGPVLQPGMTFAIEPMITMGKYDVYVTDDGWTVKTVDKSLAAHVEDTIVITEDGPKVLTRNNYALQQ